MDQTLYSRRLANLESIKRKQRQNDYLNISSQRVSP